MRRSLSPCFPLQHRLSMRSQIIAGVASAALVAAVLAGPPLPHAAAQQPPQGPAPTEDRVGFPEGYRDTFRVFFVMDRPDNKQVRVIWANDVATTTKYGEPYPHGSVFVMETWSTKKDEAGNVLLDEHGRYQQDQLTNIFVQRKEAGFGEAYGAQRSGEWEYVAFRPDRSYSSPPQNTNACAACHQDAGKTRDFVFRADLFHMGKSGAVPTAPAGVVAAGRLPIEAYSFLPETATIKAGTTITWVNEDEAIHTVVAADGSFESPRLSLGDSFSQHFDTPGTVEYIRTIHPAMRATLVVEE